MYNHFVTMNFPSLIYVFVSSHMYTFILLVRTINSRVFHVLHDCTMQYVFLGNFNDGTVGHCEHGFKNYVANKLFRPLHKQLFDCMSSLNNK